MKHHFILTLLSVLLLASGATAKTHPNIIFILADDWGLGDIQAYGGERCKIPTPNMNKLAKDGMMFTDAHSSSSVCTPTRYSVLTGRYNWRSRQKKGVLNGYSPALIESDRETVASFLKSKGYHTACIGKWHLGMGLPTTDGQPATTTYRKEESVDQCNIDWSSIIINGPNSVGFDYYWGIAGSLNMPPFIWIQNDRFVGECTVIKKFIHPAGPAHIDFEDYDVLPTLAKKSVEYITQQARSPAPFFLYLPLNSPHTPIAPSKAWQGKSTVGPYGDFVMETDWAVGEVIKAIEKAGIATNTLLIVTADNGCSPIVNRDWHSTGVTFITHKKEPYDPDAHYASDIYRGHKADIYEGGHRVPFIARWDGKIKPGSICDQTICLVDLFATCADIIGQSYPDTAAEDSVGILPCLLGKAKSPVREATVHHSINGSFAIRQGNWKLALCPGSGGWSTPLPPGKRAEKSGVAPASGKDGWVQLFDLETDPAEQNNVAGKHPETVKRLTALAQKYIDDGRSTPGAKQQNTGKTHLYPEWIRNAHP